MQFIAEYGLFLAKTLTLVAAILVVVGGVAALALRQRRGAEQNLEITHLNKEYERMEEALSGAVLSPPQLKQKLKLKKRADKKADKAQAKADKQARKSAGTEADEPPQRRLYVLDFDGDIRATAVDSLRQEISAILTMAEPKDEVMVRLESGGGVVHGYGLAASQLQRIRERGIALTVAVDRVAASGGYMMACVADKLIAAPFAIIGSIGVVTQIPNLHRLLKKHDVDFELLHAGEYKRTLTMFGENTDKGRKKMQQELDEIHDLFKQHVKSQRPNIDIDKIATGEHWLGSRALELGLVDQLQTSDDYLMAARQDAQLMLLEFSKRKSLLDRLTDLVRLHWLSADNVSAREQPLLL